MWNARFVALSALLAFPLGGWAMGRGNGHGQPQPITCPSGPRRSLSDNMLSTTCVISQGSITRSWLGSELDLGARRYPAFCRGFGRRSQVCCS